MEKRVSIRQTLDNINTLIVGHTLEDNAIPGKVSKEEKKSLKNITWRATYRQPKDIRSRSYVEVIGAQQFPQLIQESCFPQTVDIDIENCLWSLMWQIFTKLEIENLPNMSDLMELLLELLDHRETICLEKLKKPVCVGKKILISTFQGASTPSDITETATNFLLKVRNLGRVWRWTAISLQPDQFKKLVFSDTKAWPEATHASHSWFAVEDFILRSLLSSLLSCEHQHLSAHHDGIRIDEDSALNILKNNEEKRILSEESSTPQINFTMSDFCRFCEGEVLRRSE